MTPKPKNPNTHSKKTYKANEDRVPALMKSLQTSKHCINAGKIPTTICQPAGSRDQVGRSLESN